MATIFPLYTYPGGLPVRKKVTAANATSTAGVANSGYFIPEDVWRVNLEDLQNALALNSTVSYNLISQKKQLNKAKIALLYNTEYSNLQMVWCQRSDPRTGPLMIGARPYAPFTSADGFYTSHVFTPNYDSITPGGSPLENSTDGLGVWNGQADRTYEMLRLWHLPTATTVATRDSSNGVSNIQDPGTPDHLWWFMAGYCRPLASINYVPNLPPFIPNNQNSYGDVLTFKLNALNQVEGMFTTRVNTNNGGWFRLTSMDDARYNWTMSSYDNIYQGRSQPYDNKWWHEIFTRPSTFDLAQSVDLDWVPSGGRKPVQFSVVVLEPNSYMKVYFCLASSQNTEVRMNALIGNFQAVLDLIFPDNGGYFEVTVEDVVEICVLLNWYTPAPALKITLTANTLVGSFIANDAAPRAYASLDSNVRALIRVFATQCVEMPNINLDSAYLRFASNEYSVNPVNLLQTYPELGCYMPSTYMDNYWRSLRTQLTIPVGLQRAECFFAPCTSNANVVKTAAVLRASGQVVSCGPLISCVNISNTTVTNSGQLVGNVAVANNAVCQTAYTDAKAEAKKDPGGGTNGGGGSGTGGGGNNSGTNGGGGTAGSSDGLSTGAIVGIVVGVVVFILALGLGLGLGLPKASSKEAAETEEEEEEEE